MTYDVTWGENRSTFSFHDRIDINKIHEAHGVLHGSINYQHYHGTIWNFLDGDYSSIKLDQVKEPAYVSKAASFSVHYVKIALVAKEKYIVDLCNEFVELYKKMDTSWEVRIFDSMDSAVQWCHSKQN